MSVVSISRESTHLQKSSTMNTYVVVFFALVAAASSAVLPSEPIAILRQVQDVGFDGSYSHSFETANGIQASEQGILKNAGSDNAASEVTGSASWTAPDGTPVQISYIANENGAQFSGSHLPTPPPVPELPPYIKRALEWIATHPYVEPQQKKF